MLTVDEQLFTTKARCPFTQYMPKKPGKFGIKFWVLADAEKPYVLNMKPYLGKQYDENRGQFQLGEFVVMELMKPFLGKGYNVTTDNFFTSYRLSQSLLAKKTTLVGTVRANRKELPAEFTNRSRKLHSTIQGYSIDGKSLLLSCKVKQAKIVNILSTMHHMESDLCQDGSRKPSVILFYNSTKGGGDRVDQMCRLYSTKPGSRRWPFQVFCNMLDVAGINSHTVFKMANNSRQSRRNFLLQLVSDLVAGHRAKTTLHPLLGEEVQVLEKRVKCHKCNKNLTTKCCSRCHQPVCGKCIKPMHICLRC